MVRQAVDVLGHPVWREGLEHLNNTGMQPPPPLPQEAGVGDLVRQGMLEGIDALRDKARLIEELGRLQPLDFVSQLILGHSGDCLQQGPRHLEADDRRSL